VTIQVQNRLILQVFWFLLYLILEPRDKFDPWQWSEFESWSKIWYSVGKKQALAHLDENSGFQHKLQSLEGDLVTLPTNDVNQNAPTSKFIDDSPWGSCYKIFLESTCILVLQNVRTFWHETFWLMTFNQASFRRWSCVNTHKNMQDNIW